ncbi:MAG: 7-cyano-7-deazaguanine synthase QueC [Nitrospinota bacterium]|nr:7-cyano-7-deazaguanine synthase QueC [Nitrospinota bacterium]
MGRAVVLLSGGADSATCLGAAVRDGYEIYALTIDYGQSHKIEIEMAKKQAEHFRVKEHLVLDIDLRRLAKSALTGSMEVPKGRGDNEIDSGIPSTYVPARNTIFLSLALGWAETVGTGDIFIGVNAVDYSGYPDCRPDFIESFENTARLATKMGVEHERELEIHTPLIHLSKGEIFKLGSGLGVDFSKTHSCYSPVGAKACGECDSCRLRLKGFADAGLKDPLEYK